ncbi:hypothetical protein AAG570_004085 [Ranatra chinensis]|uniref:Peptidase S1 domain-containing protein n=1 Tax=Ranatra chinensis TaxID=642074 RepID=A0ABD0YRC2_9HEMI
MQEFEVAERIVHPEYNEPLIYNDVALLKLDRDAAFTRTVRPVCLSTMPRVPFTSALATGWGRTGFIEDLSPQLRGVELNTLNITRCEGLNKSARVPNGVLQERMVCAGDLKGIKDTCQGDSGGPLVIKLSTRCLKTQIGITSFGERCALANSPGIYTRVSFYVPWIEKIIWP